MPRQELIGAIDQGTTSTRFIVFDRNAQIVSSAQREHLQIYPQPGWVEHNPTEILGRAREVIAQALNDKSLRFSDLAAIGITNQRETTVLWDRQTGEPVGNAIVWQDMRVADTVAELLRAGGVDQYRDTTGLPVSTYFSGLKIRWMLENIPGVRERARNGDVLFGNIDSFLIWNLTGGPSGGRHLTDVTNASRTQLMNIDTLDWDPRMLQAFDIPHSMLPKILPSSAPYGDASTLGGVCIGGVLGDQQAALVGQTCFRPGETKNTYGTGCFMLMNTGTHPTRSRHGLLTTVAYKFGTDPAHYALEGSVAISGALVQWLRDNLGIISSSNEIESLARTVDDNGGIYFVPAFSGLYAPHWDESARGVIVGLTRYANKGHLARAVLEATAYQTREIVDAMELDSKVALQVVRADGGMVANELLMQFQADILNRPVVTPKVPETTALGAAYAAGLTAGIYDLEELRSNWRADRTWTPNMSPSVRQSLFNNWKKAVTRSRDWVEREEPPLVPADEYLGGAG